jgi:hypothetical protein
VVEDIVLIQRHKRIAESAVRQRLPSISFIEYADAGGLFGRRQLPGALPSRPRLRRQDPQGRQTRRHSDRATDDLRVRDQRQDRQGARVHRSSRDPPARGPTDRMRSADAPGGLRRWGRSRAVVE